MNAPPGSSGAAAGGEVAPPSWITLLARVGGLLAIYFVLEWWLLRVGRLPESSYETGSIALEVLESLFIPRRGVMTGLAQLGILATLGFAFVRWRHALWVPWSRLDGGRYLRVLVTVVAGILAWAYGTYDYNLYYDQAHLFDRCLLLGLALLVVWRPVFVLPFVLMAVAVIWQFRYPIRPYSVAEQFALVRILILLVGTLLLRGATGKSWSSEFVYLSIILMAASYLRCGIGKAELDWATHGILNWMTHGHIYFLMLATYANGWLGFLEPDAVVSVARRVAALDWLMVGGTIILECGALFVLWRRWSLRGFLAGWIGFHLGVFAVSGICFWKWMMVDGTLLIIFLARDSGRVFPIFSRRHFALSLLLILGGIFWFRPVNLAWYDSPTTYAYRFVAVGESGATYSLSPRFFAPYDYQFTLGNFHYLSDQRGLDVTWGAIWSRDAADALKKARSGPDVERIEQAWGENHFDEEAAARMDAFIQQFVGTFNHRGYKTTPLSVIRAPRQLWTFPRLDAYAGEEPIRRVVVHQVTTLFDGTSYREFRIRELRQIEIPPRAES